MVAQKLNPTRERHWICAQRLRERRLALGLTQREVAARLLLQGSQITNRGLSAMENGRGLDLGLLPELAESLCCTVTYLLGLTADARSWTPDPAAEPVVPAPAGAADRVVQPGSVEIRHCGGVLGPDVPSGFVAPSLARRRA
jgi:transcriptional regulator with XRE-family HTH domain